MTDSPVPEFVVPELRELEIDLSPEVLSLLARYLDLLLTTNQQFNLTAVTDRDLAWRRHIIDSLTLLPGLADLPGGGTVIDVGSGGGLPGIPLAAARPDLRMTLLEATGKKARYLERCARELPLPQVSVLQARAEEAGQDRGYREKYDVAICRAIGPMRELLEYALPLVRVGGLVLAMKGPKVEAELEQAGDALTILGGGELQVVDAYPPGSESGGGAVIVSISKDRPTPRAYPRLPGVPRHQPL